MELVDAAFGRKTLYIDSKEVLDSRNILTSSFSYKFLLGNTLFHVKTDSQDFDIEVEDEANSKFKDLLEQKKQRELVITDLNNEKQGMDNFLADFKQRQNAKAPPKNADFWNTTKAPNQIKDAGVDILGLFGGSNPQNLKSNTSNLAQTGDKNDFLVDFKNDGRKKEVARRLDNFDFSAPGKTKKAETNTKQGLGDDLDFLSQAKAPTAPPQQKIVPTDPFGNPIESYDSIKEQPKQQTGGDSSQQWTSFKRMSNDSFTNTSFNSAPNVPVPKSNPFDAVPDKTGTSTNPFEKITNYAKGANQNKYKIFDGPVTSTPFDARLATTHKQASPYSAPENIFEDVNDTFKDAIFLEKTNCAFEVQVGTNARQFDVNKMINESPKDEFDLELEQNRIENQANKGIFDVDPEESLEKIASGFKGFIKRTEKALVNFE